MLRLSRKPASSVPNLGLPRKVGWIRSSSNLSVPQLVLLTLVASNLLDQIMNNRIPLPWFNYGMETFKIRCKKEFL